MNLKKILIGTSLFFYWNSLLAMPMKLQEDIKGLSLLKPDKYMEQVDKYRLAIVNHLKFEREECQTKHRPARRIPRKERKILNEKKEQCLNLVNDWKGEYFRALYEAKKRYVSGVHQQEIKMIENAFEKKGEEGNNQ